VKIGDRIVSIPGYQVTSDEENQVQLTGGIGTPKAPEPKQAAAPAEAVPATAEATPEPALEAPQAQ